MRINWGETKSKEIEFVHFLRNRQMKKNDLIGSKHASMPATLVFDISPNILRFLSGKKEKAKQKLKSIFGAALLTD